MALINEQLKAFGRDLFKVCRKHGASIEDSRVTFWLKDTAAYSFEVWASWEVDPKEAVKIWRESAEEIE